MALQWILLVAAVAGKTEMRTHDEPAVTAEDIDNAIADTAQAADELTAEETAEGEGTNENTAQLTTLQSETQEDKTVDAQQMLQWNNQISPALNGIKQGNEMVNFKSFNAAGAQLNDLKDNEEEAEEETDEVEDRVGAFGVDMHNRGEVLSTQLGQIRGTCDSLLHWCGHATPIINIQEEALSQVDSWTNHLEGQMIKVAVMLQRIEKELLGGEPSNVMDEVDSAEAAEVGKTPEEEEGGE
jgi:hypothetical protein